MDLWTKQAVFAWRGLPGENPPWWLIDGYVGIETAVNIGAVFGIGAGRGLWFAALSIFAAVGIFFWLIRYRAIESWFLTVALSCVVGGILGNLYDRLGFWYGPWKQRIAWLPEAWKSGVRDWILWQANDQWKWPNFNIADSLLVVGAAMLMIQSLRTPQPAVSSHASSPSDTEPHAHESSGT